MIGSLTVHYCEHVSQPSFESVVATFGAELGSVKIATSFDTAVTDQAADLETRFKAYDDQLDPMHDLTNDQVPCCPTRHKNFRHVELNGPNREFAQDASAGASARAPKGCRARKQAVHAAATQRTV